MLFSQDFERELIPFEKKLQNIKEQAKRLTILFVIINKKNIAYSLKFSCSIQLCFTAWPNDIPGRSVKFARKKCKHKNSSTR